MRLRLILLLRWLAQRLGNLRRAIRPAQLDWVVLSMEGPLTELPPRRPWLLNLLLQLRRGAPEPRCDLLTLRQVLKRVAADPRPRGVVLRWRASPNGWATAAAARRAIERFRAAGGELVFVAEELGTVDAYVAAAADRIVLAPAGTWSATGLSADAVFLKDALARIGVQAEVLQVAPYKTAGDTLARSDMSEAHREMLAWLLDAQEAELVAALATGRGLDETAVRAAIDGAPMSAARALELGLIDRVGYMDEFHDWLDAPRGGTPELLEWPAAHRVLLHEQAPGSGQAVAVVGVEGMIVPGRSRNVPSPLPVGDGVEAGAESVARALRQAEQDPNVCGVVLYVDSRGGSGVASDLIWREVARVDRTKPVVAYLGDTAASGGYYVAAGARLIVCTPATITGSIGVLLVKLVTQGLLDRLDVGHTVLQRGAHARTLMPDAPFSDDERKHMRGLIDELYGRFRARVAEGRGDRVGDLEPLAGGRVWLGSQARAHGLVDGHGDMQDAIDAVLELAEVPRELWTPLALIGGSGGPGVPAAWPEAAALVRVGRAARPWLLMPWWGRIR